MTNSNNTSNKTTNSGNHNTAESQTYTPSQEILQNYADVLVKFALNEWKPIEKGSIVWVNIPESAKPFYLPLQNTILKLWGLPMMNYKAEWVSRDFIDLLPDDLVEFYPKDYLLKRVDAIDHVISIIATDDKHELDGVDSKKLFKRQAAGKFYRDAVMKKENEGDFTFTLALYWTQAMADEVDLSVEKYWDQIIKACFLDSPSPVDDWKKVFVWLKTIKNKLDAMNIESVHMVGDDCDLTIKLWKDRDWMVWSWRNIPSFEVFASPDRRGTSWWISFDQPLYRYGSLVEWIHLEFEDWLVTKASAKKNEELLLEMIRQENANKVWEYSLTDSRLSRITQFMGETLYDENRGGQYGNSHIALWMAYKDAFPWDKANVTKEQREEMWYNDSIVHTDIITTTDRTVTATLASGEEKVIYKNWQFTFWNPDEDELPEVN